MIRCTKFRPYEKNTLRGFVALELSNVGLVIHDCTWHCKEGKEWIGFPARTYQGNDGVAKWMPMVEFAEGAREARAQFQQQALEAVHAAAKEAAP
jgi:hypothetical protein